MRCKQHKQVVLYENPMQPGEGYCYLCRKWRKIKDVKKQDEQNTNTTEGLRPKTRVIQATKRNIRRMQKNRGTMQKRGKYSNIRRIKSS